ncbi:MAG: tetratricopeptide repeat protein [Bacteroidota bacterium]
MTNPRLQQIQEMLKNEPKDSFLNYALALEYAKAQDLPKAIELIESLLLQDENYLGAYYQLGSYYEQTGQIKNAIETYKKGIIIAQQEQNRKTLGELKEALMILEEDN